MASDLESQLNSVLINQFNQSPQIQKLSPTVRSLLEPSINKAIQTVSPNLFNSVNVETNKQLDAIPQNLIGSNNPVDIVNSNINSTQLSTTLSPLVNESLTGPLTSQLNSLILNDFVNKLPPNLASTLNIGGLTSAITNLSTGAIGSGLNFSLDQVTNVKFNSPIQVASLIPDVASVFSQYPAAGAALAAIEQQYSTVATNKAIKEAQQFNVKAPENEEKLITQTVGFIDPEATYPTKEYQNRTEVNKLATGDVNGTIVQKKDKERKRGLRLPEDQFWEQPPIPYKAQYPYNKITQTESGHIIEIDDTPGAERLQVYHRTGTFVEIDSTGTVVKRTKGSSYEIIDRNGYISVTGDANLSVKGGVKVYIGQNADIEVDGDVNLKCKNDITMQAAGRVDISATEEINLHSANINIEADVNLSMKGDINAFLHSTDIQIKANNDIKTQVLNNYYLRTEKNVYLESYMNFNMVSGTSMLSRAGSQYHVQAGSTINMDGSQTYIQSGTSAQATASVDSLYAYAANIGLIGTRKDVIYETIPDPVAPNYLDSLGLFAEDAELAEESKKQEQQLKQYGVASDSDLQQKAVEVERDTPSSSNSTVVKPDDSLLTQTYLPENYQLSKHFTLASVTTKAAVSKYPLVPQAGLTYGQIAYNLQGLALNVLEPLLALYPKMLITSAFRSAASSSSTSDHPRGKAVDIQFPGVRKEEYYEIAKKLATQLNYDKLLLEYKTYGTGLPWIHISFDVNTPRKIVLTYLNDRKYGDGLVNIA
jgi:hypothetical protein